MGVAHPRRDHGPERPERGRRLPRREGPPRLRLQGAAGDHRGRPQARPAPLRGRDQQPRARHRHGRGRPGRPDRVAAVGRQRPPARRPGRPPGRRGLPRACCSPSTGATSSRRRSRSSGCARAASRRCTCRPTRSTYSPSRSWPPPRWTPGTPTTSSTSYAARRRSPTLPRSAVRRHARPALRPLPQRRVRRAATPAGVGPGLRRAEPGDPAPSGWPSRAAAPSPTAGLFGVFLVGEKASRVGELDEEMVYESRVGDVFTLGTTSWRIEDITHDRVLVSPAPGQPGRLPFWTGDTLGRPAELGAAIGQFTREVSAMTREAGDRQRHRRRPRRVGRRQPGLADRGAARGHPRGPPRPAARGRALPRRARRLAAGRALAVRHAGALPVGAGDRRAAARALRDGRPGDGHRRRHRAAHPRDRPGPARRRADRLRARRARADRHHRGRRLGAVRLPLPRVRCAGSAAAAPRPRSAGAPVAATPALRAAARSRRPLPVVPDHSRDRPRGPPGSSTTCRRWWTCTGASPTVGCVWST